MLDNLLSVLVFLVVKINLASNCEVIQTLQIFRIILGETFLQFMYNTTFLTE
jgi:hypothetical protein